MGSEYRMTDMETLYFYPTEEEIVERVAEKKVQRIINQGLLGTPVYMITGLKIATGFGASPTNSSEMNVSGELSGDPGVLAAGVPTATVGVHGSWGTSISEKDEFKAKHDIVFAYQLRKIQRKVFKSGGELKIKEFLPKNTFLTKGQKSAGEEEMVIELSADEGVEIGELGEVQGKSLHEETDEEGDCVYLSLVDKEPASGHS